MKVSRLDDNITRRTLFLIACSVLIGGAVSVAATLLIDGADPLAAASWDNGLPTAANPGLVNSGVTGTFAAGAVDSAAVPNMAIIIQGGTLTKADSGHLSFNHGFNSFTMTSGLFDGDAVSSTRVLQFNGGTFDQSGGLINWDGDIQFIGTGAVALNGGTLDIGSQLLFQRTGSSFDLNGGVFNVNSLELDADNSSLTFKSGSTTAVNVSNQLKFDGSGSTVNFEDATGTGSLSINGFDATQYEAWYTAGNLLFGGSNAAAFSSVFDVSGTTLTAIPEPSTLGLLGVSTAMSLLVRRKLML